VLTAANFGGAKKLVKARRHDVRHARLQIRHDLVLVRGRASASLLDERRCTDIIPALLDKVASKLYSLLPHR